jgi:hypothetical protein
MMSNRRLAILTIGLLILEWILFKLAYPFPDLMADSYSYLTAAILHRDINIWPIGYSKFLWLFHSMTHSATALVSFQFFALGLASLYFYCQLRRYFHFGSDTSIVLYVFLFCNPLLFYLSNLLASDSIFAALTILWFAELLRFLFGPPSFWRLWPQALLIGMAYTFRYTAIYYPIITAGVMIWSKNKLSLKLTGSLLFLVFFIPFIIFSRHAGKILTGGVPTYSILSGWQLGNNAMEMRGQITVDTAKLPSPACVELDKISQAYFANKDPRFKTYLDSYNWNYFIVEWDGPLKTYMLRTYGDASIRSWALSGITFSEYGKYIMRTYPLAYYRYHILPNVKFYFIPPLQDLEIYNTGSDSVSDAMHQWFEYPSRRIRVVSKTLQGSILAIFPFIFLALNIAFLAIYLLYIVRRRKHLIAPNSTEFNSSCMVVASFLLLNALFSIIANRACLRYEFFPMMLFLIFSALLLEKNNTAYVKPR